MAYLAHTLVFLAQDNRECYPRHVCSLCGSSAAGGWPRRALRGQYALREPTTYRGQDGIDRQPPEKPPSTAAHELGGCPLVGGNHFLRFVAV